MNKQEPIGLIAVLIMILLLWATYVFAHDHEHPELSDWYMGLHSHNHLVCCDGKEAVHLADPDWQTQNKPYSHYRVYLNNRWVDVPDDAVVDEPNRDGRAMVWPMTYVDGDVWIRCFMPGSLT